jgi:hypothetical protein
MVAIVVGFIFMAFYFPAIAFRVQSIKGLDDLHILNGLRFTEQKLSPISFRQMFSLTFLPYLAGPGCQSPFLRVPALLFEAVIDLFQASS